MLQMERLLRFRLRLRYDGQVGGQVARNDSKRLLRSFDSLDYARDRFAQDKVARNDKILKERERERGVYGDKEAQFRHTSGG